MKETPPTFIDLFCGCGGFTLGMLRAGFRCCAAIDFHPPAVAALKANLADRCPPGASAVEHALEKDLTKFSPAELAMLIGTERLDVIVGGPPCQGFSTARQRDGSNHGTERLKEDPRRHRERRPATQLSFTMWKITADLEEGKAMSVCSCDYDEQHEAILVHRFRLLDGDRVPYFEGVSDDATSERAFGPLDDFGGGYAGCALIEYLEGGKWSPL